MLSSLSTWAPLGLLILGAKGTPNDDHQHDSSVWKEITVYDTTTVIVKTTSPVTHYVDVTVSHYFDVTYTNTTTAYFTESSTTTLHYTVSTTATDLETVSVTETDSATITNTETDLATVTNTETDLATITNTATVLATITNTETDSATITNTETDSTTVTNTETDSTTITNTETDSTTITQTSYTTTTLLETTYDPCPKACSISAGTVNLYFWPSNRLIYGYPTTYVDKAMGYTFTWPSVYMYIPTAKGTNSLGPTGPSTANWMLPLDLADVSTIRDGPSGSITTQLTLSDLHTDCPKTADAGEIATMINSACDPILAAPRQVSTWAYPCNACGRFGLFDPPYALPTVTSGLVPTTTAVTVTATPPPPPSSSVVVGVLLVVYCTNGTPIATATIPNTGVSGTQTTSINITPTATPTSTGGVSATSSVSASTLSGPSPTITPTTSTSSHSASSTTSTTSIVTASATRVTSGLAWVISVISIAVILF